MPTRKKGQGESRNPDTSQNDDLKRREYRDSQGNIHHHTHEYMRQHEGEKKE